VKQRSLAPQALLTAASGFSDAHTHTQGRRPSHSTPHVAHHPHLKLLLSYLKPTAFFFAWHLALGAGRRRGPACVCARVRTCWPLGRPSGCPELLRTAATFRPGRKRALVRVCTPSCKHKSCAHAHTRTHLDACTLHAHKAHPAGP